MVYNSNDSMENLRITKVFGKAYFSEYSEKKATVTCSYTRGSSAAGSPGRGTPVIYGSYPRNSTAG